MAPPNGFAARQPMQSMPPASRFSKFCAARATATGWKSAATSSQMEARFPAPGPTRSAVCRETFPAAPGCGDRGECGWRRLHGPSRRRSHTFRSPRGRTWGKKGKTPIVQATGARHALAAVAPIWDGNETWLVVTAVILWGAFPVAYAGLLSAFYLPLLIMLAELPKLDAQKPGSKDEGRGHRAIKPNPAMRPGTDACDADGEAREEETLSRGQRLGG